MTTSIMAIRRAAAEAAGWFETAPRHSTTTPGVFVRVREGAPDWVRTMVRTAHADMLPDDWRYEAIRDAVDYLAEITPAAEERTAEYFTEHFTGAHSDIYTRELLAWLASHGARAAYVDEARELYGGTATIMEDIRQGQRQELAEVFGLVFDCLTEHACVPEGQS